MQQLPLSQTPVQTFNAVLAGQNCTISLYWRQTRLYLDLAVNDTQVCRGAACQNRADVLQSPSRHFAGSLHFFDLEGDCPPEWGQLHTGDVGRFMLIYVAADETFPESLRY